VGQVAGNWSLGIDRRIGTRHFRRLLRSGEDSHETMKPVAWMVGASVVSWLIVARVAGAGANPEILYGMLAPLLVAAVSWVVTERTYRSKPERLTGVMVQGL